MTAGTSPHDSVAADVQPVDFWASRPMENMKPEWRRMRTRLITPESLDRWEGFALSEWELSGAAWQDFHPHSETNLVLEGELHIECDGQTVVLGPGDAARVNAGRIGRYWAPVYARMIAIYGPNPDGLESDAFKYSEI
ncbi:cupin domain-containing protein [Arthrobacter sp. I2-34]|uniref:Cupin domain-containing protein n=1 Tax=Arthrobacter hankyongi TaxID=2904801 RepID=A0ABS9LE58_9MICC|nr:cupin domain-containing protein [Arthrobacter hankyongi]MCG2624798.1 cupin domain-containing protein [Arthrobacter hankyongi]